MSSRTARHNTVVPLAPSTRRRTRPRPAGVTPGHPDLLPGRNDRADAGRRLEAIVAREARLAGGRRLSDS